ncbi:MAG: hypothetical protein CME59_11950 [Halioglobus sp.]|nr:hypothetical protein [Halioglobus sp.]|tara:strand:+ start:370 stop:840 length:471 start_codon:yes stop_codon:yes gene_type:complete
MIVARPNQSATWRGNLLLLLALAVPTLGVAVAFALAGAWPILPLAGLELAALGCALYCSVRKQQYRQVITLSEDTVAIDKGFYAPAQSWRLRRDAAGITVLGQADDWRGPELALHDRNCSVTLGEFLGRDEQLALIELLRGELRCAASAPRMRVGF